MRRRTWTVVLFGLVGCAVPACGGSAKGWSPAPPAGTTYLYQYQGFKERSTVGFGGAIPGALVYGGAFSFREGRELRGDPFRDPFAESVPINGISFNEHLGPRGRPLAGSLSSSGPPASSSPPPAPAGSTR
jgi:hypothetical protein